MNFSPNEFQLRRPRKLSFSTKIKNPNQVTLPSYFPPIEQPHANTNRSRRISLGVNQHPSQISLGSKSSRLTQQTSPFSLESLRDNKNAASSKPFKDFMKTDFQKALVKTSSRTSNYEIKVRILSNYGNERLVTSGEIDILDRNQATIRNISCSIPSDKVEKSSNNNNNSIKNNIPSLNIEDTSYRLINQNIIKNSVEETWTHNWEDQTSTDKKYLDVKFTFQSQEKPCYIRVFPSPFIPDANIRSLQVYVNEIFLYEGEISQTFFSVIELPYSGTTATDLIQYIKSEDRNMPHLLRDKFGLLPFCLTKEISISIVDTCNRTSASAGLSDSNNEGEEEILFGIRKIAFFTTAGEFVKPEMLELSSTNIKCFQPLEKLFTEEHTLANNQLWKASFSKNNQILISFPKPLALAAIGILSPASNEMKVKKITVKVNGLMRWIGIIDNPHVNNKNADEPFFLYLTNHKETKQKVPKYFS